MFPAHAEIGRIGRRPGRRELGVPHACGDERLRVPILSRGGIIGTLEQKKDLQHEMLEPSMENPIDFSSRCEQGYFTTFSNFTVLHLYRRLLRNDLRHGSWMTRPRFDRASD